MNKKKIVAFVLPIILVIALDRVTKFLVRTNPSFRHITVIPGWFNFDYTLNPGMAMGINLLSTPVVSVIAIIATIAIIGWVLYSMKRARRLYLVFMGMIVGGAIGNIIDRIILAKIEGYGGILDGHVVDFIHFTPTLWGHPVFPYIFNFADASITIAIICLLIFNKAVFQVHDQTEEPDSDRKKPAVTSSKADSKSTSLGH